MQSLAIMLKLAEISNVARSMKWRLEAYPLCLGCGAGEGHPERHLV